MENIIKKSIVGGWQPKYEQTTINSSVINFCEDGSILATDEVGRKLEIYDKEKIILDPLFWQALGKACGLGNKDREYYLKQAEDAQKNAYEATDPFISQKCLEAIPILRCKALFGEWEKNALRFHEINLTEGWDKSVAYLQDLIK